MTKRKETTHIIIHHSGTNGGTSKAINQGHIKRGFRCIGYHYVIERQGIIVPCGIFGRHLMDTGAHCRAKGMNHKSIGVCMIGNGQFDDLQVEALWNLVSGLRERGVEYRRLSPTEYSPLEVAGHGDFSNTKCPGFDTALSFGGWCDPNVGLAYA